MSNLQDMLDGQRAYGGTPLSSYERQIYDCGLEEIAELTKRAETAERERDAALASLWHAGQFLSVPDPILAQRLGESLRAWLDPDCRASVYAAMVRKAAGLEG